MLLIHMIRQAAEDDFEQSRLLIRQLPSARLEQICTRQRGHSQPFHRANQIFTDLKQHFGIIKMRTGADDCPSTFLRLGRFTKWTESSMKIPEPTKTASAPSWRTSAASAGVAIPPAEKLVPEALPSGLLTGQSHTGPAIPWPCRTVRRFVDRKSSDFTNDGTQMFYGMHYIARASLSFGANHGRSSTIRRRASPRLRAPQTKWMLNSCFLT